jgi:hypothetical protein
MVSAEVSDTQTKRSPVRDLRLRLVAAFEKQRTTSQKAANS